MHQVPWLDSEAWSRNIKTCPFNLSAPITDSCTQEQVNTDAIALANLSSSVRERYFQLDVSFLRVPRTYYAYDWTRSTNFVFMLEHPRFGLITSDDLNDSSEWLYLALFQPLCLSVWIATVGTVLMVAFSFTAFSITSRSLSKCMHLLYVSTLMLLEQFQSIPMTEKDETKGDWVQNRLLRVKLISVLWLLSAFLITNAYKGVFKSNYIFEPVYTRNWTEGILKMEDFTIFLGI